MTRWIIDQEPPPTFQKVGGFTGNVDRWQIIDFTPPAFLRLDVGATPTGTGAPEGKRRRRHRHAQPQRHHAGNGDHVTLFLGSGARFRRQQSARLTNKIFEQIRTAFLEDVAVFSAQQRNLEYFCRPAPGRHRGRRRNDCGPAYPVAASRRGTGGRAGCCGVMRPGAGLIRRPRLIGGRLASTLPAITFWNHWKSC